MDRDKAKRDQRIAKRKDDPNFRSDIKSLRQKIGIGKSLAEIRDDLAIDEDQYWEDLKFFLARAYMNPESIMLEWQVKQETRYQMGIDLYSRAQKDDDRDTMAKAILILSKVDEQAIDLQKALGLLKPMSDEESGGAGYSSEDVELNNERLNKLLEERLLVKLEIKREVGSGNAVDVFPRPESRGETDQLGSTSLVEKTPDGFESGNNIRKGISNGSIDLLPIVGFMDRKN